jgi:ferric-dicitrate binding protein FerR (iron transport regulator)
MLIGLGAASPALADERSCRINEVTGGATIRNDTGEHAVAPDMELGAADTLVTGAGARIGIKCSDDIILTIGPDTELELGTLVGEIGERRDVLLNLDRGIARFLAPIRTWRIFSVSTPGGVASVRSTEWVVLVEEGATAILTLAGSVAVKARVVGGAVLPAGSGIDIDADGKVRKVGKWGAARVAKVKAVLGLE